MTNAGLVAIAKPTKEEKDFCRRIRIHFKRGLRAFFICIALSAAILISGDYLSAHSDVNAQSILFQLWPFNNVYLKQFGAAPYSTSDVQWFYTVISYSNLIWLIFLGWRVLFELSRRDVSFPRGKTTFLYQMIVRLTAISAGMIALMFFVNNGGFEILRDTRLNPSFKQPIVEGAIKVALNMAFIYFAAGLFLEFGGLGIRYVLAKTLGYFLTSPSAADAGASALPHDRELADETAGNYFQ